jgi:hypothetical protein
MPSKISGEQTVSEPTVEQQVAELVKPGILVVFYLSDGTTARARYPAGTIEDVESTLALARRTGKLLAVDSADSDRDAAMQTYLVPQHVVMVKIERAGDLLGAVERAR